MTNPHLGVHFQVPYAIPGHAGPARQSGENGKGGGDLPILSFPHVTMANTELCAKFQGFSTTPHGLVPTTGPSSSANPIPQNKFTWTLVPASYIHYTQGCQVSEPCIDPCSCWNRGSPGEHVPLAHQPSQNPGGAHLAHLYTYQSMLGSSAQGFTCIPGGAMALSNPPGGCPHGGTHNAKQLYRTLVPTLYIS
jgi:hypothetical protein